MTTRGTQGTGLAAGNPAAWVALPGDEAVVHLDDGRPVRRGGRGWVCRRCGHTVQLSREFAR